MSASDQKLTSCPVPDEAWLLTIQWQPSRFAVRADIEQSLFVQSARHIIQEALSGLNQCGQFRQSHSPAEFIIRSRNARRKPVVSS